MSKKDIVLSLNIAKYVAFIGATICVMIFQFVSRSICITLALSLYVVAFGLMFTTLVIRAVEIFKADNAIKDENAVAVDPEGQESVKLKSGQEAEVIKLSREKFWSVIGAIFFGMFTVFTFVVLVIY